MSAVTNLKMCFNRGWKCREDVFYNNSENKRISSSITFLQCLTVSMPTIYADSYDGNPLQLCDRDGRQAAVSFWDTGNYIVVIVVSS